MNIGIDLIKAEMEREKWEALYGLGKANSKMEL